MGEWYKMKPWKNKVHRIISKLSMKAYHEANTLKNGRIRKKHKSYTVPQIVDELIECLNNNDEQRAKSIFVWELSD